MAKDPHTPEEAEEFIAAVYRRLAEVERLDKLLSSSVESSS